VDGSDSRIRLEVDSSQLSQLAKVDPFDPKGHKRINKPIWLHCCLERLSWEKLGSLLGQPSQLRCAGPSHQSGQEVKTCHDEPGGQPQAAEEEGGRVVRVGRNFAA
jgi:hypothetical protein